MMPHLDLAVVNGAFSYTGRYVARTGCACTHTLTLTVELDSPPREGTTSPEGTGQSARRGPPQAMEAPKGRGWVILPFSHTTGRTATGPT